MPGTGRGAGVLNVFLAAALAASQAAALVVCVLAPGRRPWAFATVGLLALLATPCWSMIHEAIHGMAHRRPTVNEAIGRVLAILHGAPLALLRTGHLLHHRYNRIAEASEAYDAERTPPMTSAAYRPPSTVR